MSRLTDEQLSEEALKIIQRCKTLFDLIEALPIQLRSCFGPNAELEYEEIKQVVTVLEKHGYFALRNSKNVAADALRVSRTTVYNHLADLL